MNRRLEGSITVFLALVFVLIFSLILVSCEEARSAALRSYAKLMLAAGTESAASDYYRPLFDDYGLFALNLGYGSRKPDTVRLEDKIRASVLANSEEVSIARCGITDVIPYLSDDCAIVRRQMISAEKSALVESAITKLLEKMGLIAGQKKVAEAMSRKIELETDLFQIDEYTLELMRLIDGVDCSFEGFMGECRNYTLKSEFVKRFFVLPLNSVNAGINNQDLFKELAVSYVNPIAELERIDSLTCGYIGYLDRIRYLEYQLDDCYRILAELERTVADEPQQESETENDEVTAIWEEIEGLLRVIEEDRAAAESMRSDIEAATESLSSLCDSTLSLISESVQVVKEIGTLQNTLQPAVLTYEEFVKGLGDTIPEEVIATLTDSLATMKAYVGLGSDVHVTDFAAIQNTLQYDYGLLSSTGASYVLSFPSGDDITVLRLWTARINELKEPFEKFSYSGLSFDYAGFKSASAAETIKTDLAAGLAAGYLSIVLDDSVRISDALMDTSLLPSFEATEFVSDVAVMFESDDNAGEVAGGIFGNSITGDLERLLSEEVNKAYEKGMEVMYVHDHYEGFNECIEKEGDFLSYEQEYILNGASADTTNLALSVSRIMLVRLLFSSIYFFTDSTSNALASEAASLADMTGLPFLSIIIKYAILLFWSLSEALVETSAILMGRKVPIITDKNSVCVSFHELPTMTPENIKQKAKLYKDGTPSLDYGEYLLLFLLITDSNSLVHRVVNLTQENIRYEYDENFLMINCIAGFSTYLDLRSETKFIRDYSELFPFGAMKGYQVSVSAKYAYEGVK